MRIAAVITERAVIPGEPEPRVDDPRAAPYLREGEGNSYPYRRRRVLVLAILSL
jgi:hypothetical protein